MRSRCIKHSTGVLVGLALLGTGVGLAAMPPTVGAQCGADASSCKQCHEGNGQFPVAELGAWHIDHAADDFCQFCHGGDPDASEPDAAHAGMVAALSDPVAQCATCHAGDYSDKAAGYADVLASGPGAAGAAGADAAFWGADEAPVEADAGFWLAANEGDAAGPAPAPVGTPAVTSGAATTDWKNPLLAGIAGFLTAVSGMTVWSFEGRGKRRGGPANPDGEA